MDELRYLETAIEIAEGLADRGLHPFGAVLADAEGLVATGVNRVVQRGDPTHHAEVDALLRAKRNRPERLSRCHLYASCEPCRMCAAKIVSAGIKRVTFAASREVASQYGFLEHPDDAMSLLSRGGVNVVRELGDLGDNVFRRWARSVEGVAPGKDRADPPTP